MDNLDEVVQQPVWTEGRLLVKTSGADIASIDLPRLEGTELTIALLF